MPAYLNIKSSEIPSLFLDAFVVLLYSERIFRKTPRNLNIARWNKPRQIEFIAFVSVVINQTCDLCIVLFKDWPLLTSEKGELYPLGDYFMFKYIAVPCMWITTTCLVFGSLYRYERLMTIVKGTWKYRFMRILRYTMIALAILATYAYVHWRILSYYRGQDPLHKDPLLSIFLLIHALLDIVGIVFAGIIDLGSNILMTNAVLYSLPQRINEPTRFVAFKRKLAIFLSLEIFLSAIIGVYYTLSAISSNLAFGNVHLSLLAICPVYVDIYLT